MHPTLEIVAKLQMSNVQVSVVHREAWACGLALMVALTAIRQGSMMLQLPERCP